MSVQFNNLRVGMSGEEMVKALNDNNVINTYNFDLVSQALIARIIGVGIKSLKYEDNTVYYSTDGEIWKKLSNVWGMITGNLENQTDLNNALKSKAGKKEFDDVADKLVALTDRVTSVEQESKDLGTDTGRLDDSVDSLSRRVLDLEGSVSSKVGSSNIKQVRIPAGASYIEYTTDGVNWVPVFGDGFTAAWGTIVGDITNQADLLNLLGRYALSDIVDEHKKASNPHNITAHTIGLQNVDNTSDLSKPVSDPQRAAIDAMGLDKIIGVNGIKNVWVGSQADYDKLEDYDSTTVYFTL